MALKFGTSESRSEYLESSEMWCWRRMEISCTYCARNELLHKVDEETNILLTIK